MTLCIGASGACTLQLVDPAAYLPANLGSQCSSLAISPANVSCPEKVDKSGRQNRLDETVLTELKFLAFTHSLRQMSNHPKPQTNPPNIPLKPTRGFFPNNHTSRRRVLYDFARVERPQTTAAGSDTTYITRSRRQPMWMSWVRHPIRRDTKIDTKTHMSQAHTLVPLPCNFPLVQTRRRAPRMRAR